VLACGSDIGGGAKDLEWADPVCRGVGR